MSSSDDDDSPSASRSSLSLPAVEGASSRLLRLRADARLAKMLEPPARAGEGGLLKVPSRELLEPGAKIRVEISFGPLADEITLRGEVEATLPREGRAPLIAIRLDPAHAPRARYVHQVLSEGRPATARASRRVASDIQATWYWRSSSHATRVSDISKGGAFIRSGAPPGVGATISLELNDTMVAGVDAGPLALEATVAWVGRSGGRRGFGVKFRVVDRGAAGRVAALVRWLERRAGLVD